MKAKRININNDLVKSNRAFLTVLFFVIVSTLVSIQNLDFYLHFDFNFTLSLVLVPSVIYVKYKNCFSKRFGWMSLILLILYPVLKIQSLYFSGFAFFILFVIESNIGKLNNLPFFLIFLLSPLAIFAIEVFGFPIRLWLTKVSTQIISFVNNDVSASDNLILFGNNKFTVDPECMGLKMVITGYLLTLVMLAWFERKSRKELSFFNIVFILLLTSILIIISNLFRIIGIIFADAAPKTFMHELIGIFSLIIYVIIPIYFISKLFYEKFSKEIRLKPAKKLQKNLVYTLSILLIAVLALLNINRKNYRTTADEISTIPIKLEGFECKLLENGVAQLTSDSALVYFKPIANFYSADHTPMICWKGSGYQLQNQKKIMVKGHEIYFAELALKDSKPLYTAWWYSNNKHITINQLNWRWRLIKGEDNFNLVNITCEKQALLIEATQNLLK